ncbi:hypothetical protein KQI58_05865 [Enterococcus raffinosus]|uniref:acyl-CoA thioester hydrolase/BAAT C-terminal domain-containing protein n=1 Tax=Enterococcus raffinosus TaxID=71452 RepID=UPI001C108EFA|nr:acyl-CoA thioester hydrolase/BAAT C-terminal domain-containing protein [Enterococcus raffinosus]MBU5360601.1 hypothetical protein [Enterococcus raffinosus]
MEIKKIVVEKVDQGRLQGFYLKDGDADSLGAAIVFGGSEGGCNYQKAEELAKAGFEVLALFFFGKPNLPSELKQVPIELFEDALDYVKEHFENSAKLIVLGESKGAELSLLLGSEYNQSIDKLIGIVPSSHVFYGLGSMAVETSSWTKNGQEVPYLSLVTVRKKIRLATIRPLMHYLARTFRKKPVSFRNIYELCIALNENREAARIKIEKFQGELLLIAGDDDQLWPSNQMVEELQRQRSGLTTEVLVFPGVGHSIGGAVQTSTLILGGEETLNQDAYKKMMEKIIAFCKK